MDSHLYIPTHHDWITRFMLYKDETPAVLHAESSSGVEKTKHVQWQNYAVTSLSCREHKPYFWSSMFLHLRDNKSNAIQLTQLFKFFFLWLAWVIKNNNRNQIKVKSENTAEPLLTGNFLKTAVRHSARNWHQTCLERLENVGSIPHHKSKRRVRANKHKCNGRANTGLRGGGLAHLHQL